MISFEKIKNLLEDINNTPNELDAFFDKREELVKLFARDEKETIDFIKKHIKDFSSKELEEFADNLEEIFFKFYTKTFAEEMRKIADIVKDGDIENAVQKMEMRVEED